MKKWFLGFLPALFLLVVGFIAAPEKTVYGRTANATPWQIDAYATHLIGSPIAENAEALNGKSEFQWYYQTLDIKGGFASITGAVEGWKEFVLWRMADGNDLVGEMSVGCGPACDYSFTFYTGKGAQIQVCDPKSIFPMEAIELHQKRMVPKIITKYPVEYPEDSQLVFNFPRKGTGMRVDVVVGADEVRVPILQLAWDKSTFTISELFSKIEAVD